MKGPWVLHDSMAGNFKHLDFEAGAQEHDSKGWSMHRDTVETNTSGNGIVDKKSAGKAAQASMQRTTTTTTTPSTDQPPTPALNPSWTTEDMKWEAPTPADAMKSDPPNESHKKELEAKIAGAVKVTNLYIQVCGSCQALLNESNDNGSMNKLKDNAKVRQPLVDARREMEGSLDRIKFAVLATCYGQEVRN